MNRSVIVVESLWFLFESVTKCLMTSAAADDDDDDDDAVAMR